MSINCIRESCKWNKLDAVFGKVTGCSYSFEKGRNVQIDENGKCQTYEREEEKEGSEIYKYDPRTINIIIEGGEFKGANTVDEVMLKELPTNIGAICKARNINYKGIKLVPNRDGETFSVEILPNEADIPTFLITCEIYKYEFIWSGDTDEPRSN